MMETIAFLLVPGFSAMGFISAVEPLRVANRFGGQLYRWQVLSLDGEAVLASNGMSINADAALGEGEPANILLVVAGFEPLANVAPKLLHALRRLNHEAVMLGGIDTGAMVLAEAGLLEGYRATLHWEALEAFKERYPGLQATQELFEIDRSRITCLKRNGLDRLDAAPDCPVSRQRTGGQGVRAVRAGSHPSAPGPPAHADRCALWHQQQEAGPCHWRNGKHIEPPLSTLELAAAIKVTRRQLERLFRMHLDATPSGFYLGLRLDKARQLLAQTDMSVTEVSLACGFELPSYFTRRYKLRFGRCPREERRPSGTK